MERKKFLKQGIIGLSSIVAVPVTLVYCKKNDSSDVEIGDGCTLSPAETKGPFPIKTPSQLVLANIKSDRVGVAVLINLILQNKNNNCAPKQGLFVDVWHCDKDGNYSEYGGSGMQPTDFRDAHFLRGRQSTDVNGQVSFLSIYPGWYHGRAPHIHIEILSSSGASLLVTQIAFPEKVSTEIYASSLYSSRGQADTSNGRDNVFSDSLANELATITGNIVDGYTLTKTIVVNA